MRRLMSIKRKRSLTKSDIAKVTVTDKNKVYLEIWVKDGNKSLEQAVIEMQNQFANNKRKDGFLFLTDEQIESLKNNSHLN